VGDEEEDEGGRLRRPGYLLLPKRRPRDGQKGRTMEYEQDDSPISFLD